MSHCGHVHVINICIAHFTIHNNRVPRRRHHVIVSCVHLDMCERIAVATIDNREPAVVKAFQHTIFVCSCMCGRPDHAGIRIGQRHDVSEC